MGQGDIEVILATIGGLTVAYVHPDPDLWRRYLAMVLSGIERGGEQDEIPGESPDRPEVERILAGWVPPRRGKS